MFGKSRTLLFFLALAWCLAGLGVLFSWGIFSDFDPPRSVVVLFGIGILGSLIYLLVGHRHRNVLVFWCRRFGDTDELAGHLNRWHSRIIAEAAKGLAVPVTLQDESVASPPAVERAVFLPVFLTMMLGSMGTMFWLFEFPWFETIPGQVVGFFLVVLGITAPSLIAMLSGRWLGARRVSPGQVQSTARRASRGKRSHAGMLVLQCRSEHWQECVEALLELSPPTIIDVSLLSDNVDWEIEVAIKRLKPERLLLLRAERGAAAKVDLVLESHWVSLRYDASSAVDELSAFSRSWNEDQHQLADPGAPLGPIGAAIAEAIREWLDGI